MSQTSTVDKMLPEFTLSVPPGGSIKVNLAAAFQVIKGRAAFSNTSMDFNSNIGFVADTFIVNDLDKDIHVRNVSKVEDAWVQVKKLVDLNGVPIVPAEINHYKTSDIPVSTLADYTAKIPLRFIDANVLNQIMQSELAKLGGAEVVSMDLKGTGTKNEFTVEITWKDKDGVEHTTTDPTPITILQPESAVQADIDNAVAGKLVDAKLFSEVMKAVKHVTEITSIDYVLTGNPDEYNIKIVYKDKDGVSKEVLSNSVISLASIKADIIKNTADIKTNKEDIKKKEDKLDATAFKTPGQENSLGINNTDDTLNKLAQKIHDYVITVPKVFEDVKLADASNLATLQAKEPTVTEDDLLFEFKKDDGTLLYIVVPLDKFIDVSALRELVWKDAENTPDAFKLKMTNIQGTEIDLDMSRLHIKKGFVAELVAGVSQDGNVWDAYTLNYAMKRAIHAYKFWEPQSRKYGDGSGTANRLDQRIVIDTIDFRLYKAKIGVIPEGKQPSKSPVEWELFPPDSKKGNLVKVDEIIEDYKHSSAVYVPVNSQSSFFPLKAEIKDNDLFAVQVSLDNGNGAEEQTIRLRRNESRYDLTMPSGAGLQLRINYVNKRYSLYPAGKAVTYIGHSIRRVVEPSSPTIVVDTNGMVDGDKFKFDGTRMVKDDTVPINEKIYYVKNVVSDNYGQANGNKPLLFGAADSNDVNVEISADGKSFKLLADGVVNITLQEGLAIQEKKTCTVRLVPYGVSADAPGNYNVVFGMVPNNLDGIKNMYSRHAFKATGGWTSVSFDWTNVFILKDQWVSFKIEGVTDADTGLDGGAFSLVTIRGVKSNG